jgi:2-keto-4-pentenoate hydratase/2-oxohepta-3-ene-1,7-dioic acid hydratase in catechol pathway
MVGGNQGNAAAVIDLTRYTAGNVGAAAFQSAPHSYSQHAEEASRDMIKLIETGDETAQWLHRVIDHANQSSADTLRHAGALISMSEVKLSAPIPLPRRNVMCVGKNYKDHVAEVAAADKQRGIGTTSTPAAAPAASGGDAPKEPKYAQFFTKVPSAVIGPGGQIESHAKVTKWLDYEAELAVIIGKTGRDIRREDAMSYIYGYSIANDVTARDVQRQHNQWFRGKSLDTTCPLGPYLLHHSSQGFDPFNLSVKLWVNGEKRQDSNTANMIFDIPEIICQLSQGLTLRPGDVILTGTPQGVGYAMNPPQVLKPGDHCAIEIQHLGRLENTVIA